MRRVYLDWARMLAIISVTFNHALGNSFETHLHTYDEFLEIGCFPTLVKAMLYAFSRLGVPLFLMISGSLLIEREYEKKEVLDRFIRHNWLQLFITTEIWLALIYWLMQLEGDSILRTSGILPALTHFVSTLLFINQKTTGSMWYMSMILVVYLMIPVISVGVRKLGNRLFYVLTGLAVLSGMVFPNINTALTAAETGKVLDFRPDIGDIFSIYMIYILAGYWISSGMMKKLSDLTITVVTLISFILTGLFQYWIYSLPYDYYLRYRDLGILISAAFLFEGFRRVFKDKTVTVNWVLFFSNAAFGVYFLHICIMNVLKAVMEKYTTINHYPKFLILESVSLFGSLIIIWITSKNRYIRKYLYVMKG